MWRKIYVSKIPILPLYRASGGKANSLSAYGRTEQEAIERLKKRRRDNRPSLSDPLDLIASPFMF